jgi:hypothetical protein
MTEINVGDRVEIQGDTQDYILTDPNKTYLGVVIGRDNGQLLVRLDKPVARGPGQFSEVSVLEKNVRPALSQH